MNNAPIEDRKLLYRDLCARKPYGVKVQLMYAPSFGDAEPMFLPNNLSSYKLDIMEVWAEGSNLSRLFKPYLFPLSSMTEEQKEEYNQSKLKDLRMLNSVLMERISEGSNFDRHVVAYNEIDWLNKNHFDYRGLIPLGLANDATGLNIYKEEAK